jgi:hypothetical protein
MTRSSERARGARRQRAPLVAAVGARAALLHRALADDAEEGAPRARHVHRAQHRLATQEQADHHAEALALLDEVRRAVQRVHDPAARRAAPGLVGDGRLLADGVLRELLREGRDDERVALAVGLRDGWPSLSSTRRPLPW